MPRVCYNKPNRKAKRFFKPCDVARIAQNCIDDSNGTVTPAQLLATVAKQLGYTHISVAVKKGTVLEPSRESQLVDILEKMRDGLNEFLRKFGIEG
jgi:hypothetical protein